MSRGGSDERRSSFPRVLGIGEVRGLPLARVLPEIVAAGRKVHLLVFGRVPRSGNGGHRRDTHFPEVEAKE